MGEQETGAQCAQVNLKAAVVDRHELDSQVLAQTARTGVVDSKATRGQTRALLLELKRRFRVLPTGRNVDGTAHRIDGARSFNQWLGIHHIPKRNIFYILNGRKPSSPTLHIKGAVVRLTPRELKYLLRVLRGRSPLIKNLRLALGKSLKRGLAC